MVMPKLVPGTLYIIRDRDFRTLEWGPYVKIGIVRQDRDSEARKKEHQTGNPREVVTKRELQAPMVEHLETQLHQRFATNWVTGEWFEMDDLFVEQKLIPEADKIIAEQRSIQSSFETHLELKNLVSNGTTRPPRDEERDVWQAVANAKEEAILRNAHKEQWGSKLRNAVGEFGGIAGVLALTRKDHSDRFNETEFKNAHPDLAGQYIVQKPSTVRGTVSLKNIRRLAEIDPDLHNQKKKLDADKPEFNPEQTEVATMDRTPNILELHSGYVSSLADAARADWNLQCSVSRLVQMLGTDECIDGLISWKRTEKEVFAFDKSRLKQEHEELFLKFSEPVPSSVSVNIHPFRAYPLGQ